MLPQTKPQIKRPKKLERARRKQERRKDRELRRELRREAKEAGKRKENGGKCKKAGHRNALKELGKNAKQHHQGCGIDRRSSNSSSAGSISLAADLEQSSTVARRKSSQPSSHRGRGKGGGSGSRRPSSAALHRWAEALRKEHSKFVGVCEVKFSGTEFRKVLRDFIVLAGGSLRPSHMRVHRHCPTSLNQQVSRVCNEAGTQATCECHSAGTKSLPERVRVFLDAAHRARLSKVNVITGLGRHGGGGAIRQMLPRVLQTHPSVRCFEVSRNYAAFYVELTASRTHCTPANTNAAATAVAPEVAKHKRNAASVAHVSPLQLDILLQCNARL